MWNYVLLCFFNFCSVVSLLWESWVFMIMGFQENVCCRFLFLNGGQIQDGRNLCKFRIYLMWPGRTLDIVLWVNFKIAAICAKSNYKLIYFLTELRPIHDFGVDHRVFKVCPTRSVSDYCLASFSAQSWLYCNRRKPEVGKMPFCDSSVFQISLCGLGDHFISESTALKRSPAWSLATTHPDIRHWIQLKYFCSA